MSDPTTKTPGQVAQEGALRYWSLPHHEQTYGDYVAAAVIAHHEARPCTCHPDDNPPVPCPQQYALQECRRVAAERATPPPPGETPTPRTAGAFKHYRYRSKCSGLVYESAGAAGDYDVLEYVESEFASTLERELAAALERVRELEALDKSTMGSLAICRAQLAAAQDAAREVETKLDMAQAANRHLERQLAKHAKEETK